MCVDVCVFYSQLRASFTYFGDMLRCPHKRIVTITKVYIARNNIQVELIRFRKNSDFIDIGNFEVETYFRDRRAHCYPIRFSPLVNRAPGAPNVSEHSHFGTCHIGTSTIRDCTTALFQVKLPYTCSSHGKSVQGPIRL